MKMRRKLNFITQKKPSCAHGNRAIVSDNWYYQGNKYHKCMCKDCGHEFTALMDSWIGRGKINIKQKI